MHGDYGAEAVLGGALKANPALRNQIEIVTKCDIVAPIGIYADKPVKYYDTSRAHIEASVNRSLSEMGVDHVDLLLIHRPDPLMDHNETGEAPDDLATKIMTTVDPETGKAFDTKEMVDQVAIFFLAGHETSASALAWTLYLCAVFPEWQGRIAEEAADLTEDFSADSKLKISRDVFREALRLYPPVPMMVREATCPEHFRDRDIAKGSQVVISPWHLHRQERLWDNPDGFDPMRWQTANGKQCMREAYVPFSAGSRVCTGAGFAMVEGVLMLSMILKHFRITPVGDAPVPIAHLTVRSRDGINLRLERRN